MPRRPREECEGGVHHVYARGNNRHLIFLDDADRRAYLGLLQEVVSCSGWLCLAYCLMDNHIHLLVETPRPNLGPGMKELQGGFAKWFNARHDRVGHLFQSRYGSKRMKSQAQLWVAVAYIVRNPVEAGLCERPELWPWSSHSAVCDGSGPGWLARRRLLEHFDLLGSDPLEAYRALTAGVGTRVPGT